MLLLILAAGAATICPIPRKQEVECVQAWHIFGQHFKQAEYEQAYRMLTRSAQRRYPMGTMSNYAPSVFLPALVDFKTILDAPVRHYISQPFLGRAAFVATTSRLTLPLFLEDGLVAAEVHMVKEDRLWKVNRIVIHAK